MTMPRQTTVPMSFADSLQGLTDEHLRTDEETELPITSG